MNRREKFTTLYFYILILLSFLMLGFGWTSSAPPDWQHKPLEILGFYTGKEPGLPSSEHSVLKNSRSLTFIAPFYYRIKSNGSGIENWDNISNIQVKETIRLAHSKNIKALALVHNLLYGSSETSKLAANEVLRNPANRQRFITQVLNLVEKSGFDGVNLDIENIYPTDRDNFSALVKEMKESFLKADLLVTVCVPAKTEDLNNGQWGQNFDYKEIGRWADRVVIMTYDEHGYSSGPGPIASIPWVQEVVRYTVSVIPKNKILLGVPVYGFDWTQGESAPKYLSYQGAVNTAANFNRVPVFEQQQGVPYFKYLNGQNHQVWFEDARSFALKTNLAKQWDLAGIALWRLGMEDPDIWKYARKEITTTKI